MTRLRPVSVRPVFSPARATIALLLAGGVSAQHEVPAPEPLPQTQAWRVESLVDDAGLAQQAVFGVDFSRDGRVWLATSVGLIAYDGHTWRRYTEEHGLPSSYVRCAHVLRDGTLWVGTDRGAACFDGSRFDARLTDGRLAGPSVRRIREGPDGELWFSCDRWPDTTVGGGVTRLQDGRTTSFGPAEGLPSDYVLDVFVDSRGEVYLLTLRGLARLDGETSTAPLVEAGLADADGPFWSMVELPGGDLLAASSKAFFLRDGHGWRRVHGPVQGLVNPALVRTEDGEVLACAPGSRTVFLRWTGDSFEQVCGPIAHTGYDVHDLAEAPDSSIWAVGRGLILRWERNGGAWRAHAHLPRLRGQDAHGGVWFSDDRGTLRFGRDRWIAFPEGSGWLGTAGDRVWLTLPGASIMRWSQAAVDEYGLADLGLASVTAVMVDGAGTTWLCGLDPDGSPVFAALDEPVSRVVVPRSRPGERPTHLVPDSAQGLWQLLVDPSTLRHRLEHISRDGVSEETLPPAARRIQGPRIHVEPSGRRWLYGLFGLYRKEVGEEGWTRERAVSGGHVSAVVARGDTLWFAHLSTTGGQGGLSRLRADRWTHIDQEMGRHVGTDGNGRPLFATDDGLVQLDDDLSVVSRLVLPARARVERAVVDRAGVWISTGDSTLRYQPDGEPPRTHLIEASDRISSGEDLVLRTRSTERFRSGSSRRMHRIEGRLDDGRWMLLGAPGEDVVRLTTPPPGEHVVALRAVDADLDRDPVPVLHRFLVQPVPLQSRPWFVPALTALLSVVLILAVFGLWTWQRLRVQARGLEGLVQARTSELARSGARYRTLFEGSRDAILVMDAAGRVVGSNPAARALFAASEGDLVGRSVVQLFDDEALSVDDLAHGELDCLELRRAAGRQVLQVRTSPVEEDGEVGYQVLVRDVTHRKRLEERLRHTQKMEAIGRMAGGIAHDFNNILTAITGYCKLLVLSTAADEVQHQDAELVLEQAERAKALTRQIQSFSHSAVTEGQAVELNQVVRGTEALLRPLLGEHVQLELQLDPTVERVRADRGRLEQVIVNLAVNARDAMPGGGTLRVCTASDGEDPRGCFHLRVSDTGCGMDAATRERAFEPFFTTKARDEGTGLGLALVYGIVDQAGGTIELESAPGAGTTFDILLPRCEEAVQPKEVVVAAPPASCAAGSILIAEDEPAIRELMRRVLSLAGYEVRVARDGRQAVEMLECAADTSLDLLITDVVMPDMGGVELRRWVEQHLRGTPVLFVTGHDLPSGEEDPPELDGLVLTKPFHVTDLLERVRELLEGPDSASPLRTAAPASPPRS